MANFLFDGFVFPTCCLPASVRISLKTAMRSNSERWFWSDGMADSTSSLKLFQSTSFDFHLLRIGVVLMVWMPPSLYSHTIGEWSDHCPFHAVPYSLCGACDIRGAQSTSTSVNAGGWTVINTKQVLFQHPISYLLSSVISWLDVVPDPCMSIEVACKYWVLLYWYPG